MGCQGRCLNCRGTSPPQQFAPRPQRTISAPAQFAQLCNCEISLCEQVSHLHSCAIALGGRVMDARGATSSLLRRLSPSRPWLALGTCAVHECVVHTVYAESAVMINMSPICPTKAFLYMVSLKKGSFSIFVSLAPKVLLDYL